MSMCKGDNTIKDVPLAEIRDYPSNCDENKIFAECCFVGILYSASFAFPLALQRSAGVAKFYQIHLRRIPYSHRNDMVCKRITGAAHATPVIIKLLPYASHAKWRGAFSITSYIDSLTSICTRLCTIRAVSAADRRPAKNSSASSSMIFITG